MAVEGLERIVREHPFFAGLDESFLELVVGCARNVRFEAGKYLFREGGPADQLYLVREGRVALEIAAPGAGAITFQTVAEGDIVGVSWLFPPYRWQYDAHALERVRAIAMDATCLRNKCDADPGLGYDVMKRLVPILYQRLQATRLQVLDVYGKAGGLTMLQVASPDPMVPQVMRIVTRRKDAPDVFTLRLEPEGDDLPAFAPGQFNMLTAFGVGESAISVSGDPAKGDGIVHTIWTVGAVSRALAGLRKGDTLGLRGPFGVGWPMEALEGKDVVLLAGGIGLAPLRPVIYRLLAERDRFGEVAILYGTRSPGDILYLRELESWRRRLDIDLLVTVDHAADDWHGHVGVVTTLLPRVAFDPENTVALLCGPEIMMRFGVQALGNAGVPDEAIYVSMERNMKCAIGLCGHCQFSPVFICKDGPVFRYDRIRYHLALKEL